MKNISSIIDYTGMGNVWLLNRNSSEMLNLHYHAGSYEHEVTLKYPEKNQPVDLNNKQVTGLEIL